MIHERAYVHHNATVDGTVSIGARTKVWQNATVMKGTVLGCDCNVGAGAVLTGPRFGDECKISSCVVIGPGFSIGNRVFLGPCTVLANDVYPSVSAGGYDEALLKSGEHFAVVIEDDVMVGSHVTVLPGVRIGRGAVLAAGSVVTHDVSAGTIWGRDGRISAVPENWRDRRMRFVREALPC